MGSLWSGEVSAQPGRLDARRPGIAHGVLYPLRIAEHRQPFQQPVNAFALSPVALAGGAALTLGVRLGAVISGGGLMVGKQQVAEREAEKFDSVPVCVTTRHPGNYTTLGLQTSSPLRTGGTSPPAFRVLR